MTEEQREQLDVEEETPQEEVPRQEPVQVEVKDGMSAREPTRGRKRGWTVAAIAAILALCTVVVCIAVAVAAFSRGKEEEAVLTTNPVLTTVPEQAMIVIAEPDQGQAVDIDKPVKIQGKGVGLPEGNVVVEVLDWQGNLLAREPATLQGQDVAAGGDGTWSTELTVQVEPGTAGKIRAYSLSPKDGSVIAEDSVEVSLGQIPAVESYVMIDSPAEGATLEVSQPIRVSGTGTGLPEGNVVVVAADRDGNVLAEQPTTLQGPDVGAGGAGTWSVELAVPASGQTPGYIAAFSASPKQRELVASDHVEVTFVGEYTLEGTTWLLDKTSPGSEITAIFADGQVSGSAGCNSYKGTYQSTQAAGRDMIELSALATTRMACDQALMDQEGLYLAALESATEYTIEGFALTITYPGGTLIFYDKNGPRPRG